MESIVGLHMLRNIYLHSVEIVEVKIMVEMLLDCILLWRRSLWGTVVGVVGVGIRWCIKLSYYGAFYLLISIYICRN